MRFVTEIATRYFSEESLHRELLAIFDLDLAENFRPVCLDGEICEHRRLDWPAFREAVRSGDELKYSSLLVCRDLKRRLQAR